MAPCFNPCRVFSFAATIIISDAANGRLKGFNPCRVFSFAATLIKERAIHAVKVFQSLSGFLVRCNHFAQDVIVDLPNEFQSLSGFLVRCNGTDIITLYTGVITFQSLSGFLVRCNPVMTGSNRAEEPCFNPCRVFSFAATAAKHCANICDPLFQSLSGFLVRCNLDQNGVGYFAFFGFNPCRVFSFAATSQVFSDTPPVISFQSLSGFLVRCNDILEAIDGQIDTFQSLSGFLVRCNPAEPGWAQGIESRFNPCRVFSFAATQTQSSRAAPSPRVSIPVGFSRSLQPSNDGIE